MTQTAKEYIEKNNQGSFGLTQEALMIEFAKMHVTEALKQASSKSEINITHQGETKKRKYYFGDLDIEAEINKESILTAYNLDNII